jgi:hypothetical protein
MARWQSCNVLDAGAETRRVWQFNAGDSFSLTREQATRAGEQISPKLVAKSWNSLWQKRLNVAWLPPEHVFIRVAQFPQSTPDETRAMVELQLEKLSPLPVTQAVWSMHIMPQTADNMQTVIVVVAARSIVEEFLGKLESEGYLADRLELPLIDQLEATSIHEDGAYIYPLSQGLGNTAVVAWWYGGILRNVDLLTMAAEGDRGASLRDQLMQMAWAGELEGWLTAPPRWHVIADENRRRSQRAPPGARPSRPRAPPLFLRNTAYAIDNNSWIVCGCAGLARSWRCISWPSWFISLLWDF